MLRYSSILLFSFLLIITFADISTKRQSAFNIAVLEHGFIDSVNQSANATADKTLIRLPRQNVNIRHRRDYDRYIDTEEIWGMARKVAITVFVLISVCIVGCVVITIYICMRCCCGAGNNNRKRNQGFTAVPQPIIIHTTSPHYQPQQQQAPSPPMAQTWALENHPMLPQPSAPPQPIDDFRMELPPSYDKVCADR